MTGRAHLSLANGGGVLVEGSALGCRSKWSWGCLSGINAVRYSLICLGFTRAVLVSVGMSQRGPGIDECAEPG